MANVKKKNRLLQAFDAESRKKDERRTDAAEREQSELAHFAEPQGGKDRKAGLKTKDERREKLKKLLNSQLSTNFLSEE